MIGNTLENMECTYKLLQSYKAFDVKRTKINNKVVTNFLNVFYESWLM